MTAIQFDPETHTYTLDGVRLPGVTSILQAAGLGVDYSRVPPATLAWARERGTHVDQCCTLLDEGCLDWASVADEAQPYVEAWRRWTEDYIVHRPTHQQPLGYHPDLGYCGIPDVIASGALCIDRKATAAVSRTYGLQLAAYTMPGIAYSGIAPSRAPTRRGLVHLKKDGTYTFYTDHPDDVAGRKVFHESDWDTFTAACAVARWKRRA